MTTTIFILSTFSIIGTLLPIWQTDHWIVRGQMNFRQIYLALIVICIIGLLMVSTYSLGENILALSLIACSAICIKSIWPYSVFAAKEVEDMVQSNLGLQLKIYVFNVYQKNNKYSLLIESVKKKDPDVILLLETNKEWDQGVEELYDTYKYVTKDITDDTYGLILMSKLPLKNSRINYLISKNIPSGEIELELEGNTIRILGMHPKPPIPGERPTSTSKDQEITAAASYFKTLNDKESHILIGDLNEVAWSRTSLLFRKLTGMKDPRIGRGTYATFPAYSPIKFPLDHVYCSPNFSLVEYSILGSMGSDHHAVYIHFQLETYL